MRKIGEGPSQHAACEDLNIHHNAYNLWWVKHLGDFWLAETTNQGAFVKEESHLCHLFKMSCSPYFSRREQGIAMSSIFIVNVEAAQLSAEFVQKLEDEQYNTARRFEPRNGLVS
jgi:hypothetical protein